LFALGAKAAGMTALATTTTYRETTIVTVHYDIVFVVILRTNISLIRAAHDAFTQFKYIQFSKASSEAII
jgi:hypothetical protein